MAVENKFLMTTKPPVNALAASLIRFSTFEQFGYFPKVPSTQLYSVYKYEKTNLKFVFVRRKQPLLSSPRLTLSPMGWGALFAPPPSLVFFPFTQNIFRQPIPENS